VPFDSLPSRARSSSPTTTPAEHGRDLVADLSRRKGYLVVTGKARRPAKTSFLRLSLRNGDD
jgi:hypothetical protein